MRNRGSPSRRARFLFPMSDQVTNILTARIVCKIDFEFDSAHNEASLPCDGINIVGQNYAMQARSGFVVACLVGRLVIAQGGSSCW